MSELTGSGRSLTIGLAMSVVIHAGGVVGLSRLRVGSESESRGGDPGVLLELPEEPRREEVRPGIDDSTHDTSTWLGFKDPTEHSGTKSATDQAALAVNPAPNVKGIEAPAAQAGGELAVEPSREPRPEAARTDALEVREPERARAAEVESEETELLEPRPGEFVGPPAPPEKPQPLRPEPAPKPTPRPEEAASTSRGPGAAEADRKPASSGDSGLKSDRESLATSERDPIDVRPGRPAAGKGVEILTVRPRWSYTTQLTSAPRNPVVRVEFGKGGKVVKAEFVNGGTGSRDVDEPLISALYRWTAKGAAIDKLASRPEGEVVALTFRVLLR